MSRAAVALALLIPAMAAWPQAESQSEAQPETQTAFDPDAFFSSPGTEPGVLGDVASPARPAGLVFSGEASADILYTIVEPFDAAARTAGYTGATSLRLDALGGKPDEAKVEASVVVGLLDGDGSTMFLELRKLYLSIYSRAVDLSAGRMIINYGRGTVFSPVDLFSTVDVSDLRLGRTGTDALRAQLPLGSFSGLDLVATLGKPSGDGIAGGRIFGNAAGWDFGLSAFGAGLADGYGDLVAGLDFKGDLELGLSAEALARLPFSAWVPDATEAVYSLMLGADYSIGGQWFFDLEYLANLRSGSAQAVGDFRAAHNLFGSVSWKPDELTALDLRCIAAPAEGAVRVTFSLSRSVASGASVAGYLMYQGGDVTGVSLGTRLSVAY
jgi:hypothetical protein